MHRQPLLVALTHYASCHPDEADMVTRFQRFVEAYPRCFDRTLATPGHVTGSAWIVDPAGEAVLLTHHRKLDLWIQLGGHADGDPDVLAVARREGLEESGLRALEVVHPGVAQPHVPQPNAAENEGLPVPFDVDIHEIPARRDEPAHFHFDVRYAFRAVDRAVIANDESHALAWVPMAELDGYTRDASVARMAKKWLERRSTVVEM
ncbi:MAG: NUDIX hydrolase [Gammaproteobacteria bacterium]|nr:NUDIX hydrolase [Gammaproteobacteria bacterium]